MSAATEVAAGLEKLEDVVADESCTVEQICYELSRLFHVRKQEVAVLQVQRSMLRFLYPRELSSAGTIPVSSSAVAARTASSRRADYFNNFVTVQHSGIFETIRMKGSEVPNSEVDPLIIQKLMSAPVMGPGNKVTGVVQVSHKGFDVASCGPDFTSDDLDQLKAAAKLIGIFFARHS
jgi:GAF domain-containing protein